MNTHRPNLSFLTLFNISFGFFGVQIAYALQSANISRIFATLGADPHDLSYFWILPPLMGLIVQPIVGTLSDKTWNRFGRRIPYLFVGALISVLVMAMLPNAGSLGLTVAMALILGTVFLMLLDTGLNVAMQPFKMMVGDMVNNEQKGLAYSIQSFLINTGSVIGFIFPFVFTWLGVKNEAAEGVVPDSVVYSFYVGAAILVACVVYTAVTVRELPPKEYAAFHEITDEEEKSSSNFIELLKKAPATFWTVGLVQFFCWAAMVYMWAYLPGATAQEVWHTTDANSAAYQEAGNWVGILYAVEAMGAVVWAVILPFFKNRKLGYSVSLLLGGIGFISTLFVHDQYLLFVSYALVGCAWASMMAMPFTILTNSLSGKNMGAYLGLFNGTITLPQIVASLLGGVILHLVGGENDRQVMMLVVAGIFFVCGAAAVWMIKETDGHAKKQAA